MVKKRELELNLYVHPWMVKLSDGQTRHFSNLPLACTALVSENDPDGAIYHNNKAVMSLTDARVMFDNMRRAKKQ